jgi:hypothetical protein
LGMYLPCLRFLLRSQMLPCLHAVQHLLLALGRQAVEMLQALLQDLLSLRRKRPVMGVALQRLSLLLGRQTSILVQPLSSVMALLWWRLMLRRPRRLMLRWSRRLMLCWPRRLMLHRPRRLVLGWMRRWRIVVAAVLGHTRQAREPQRQAGYRHP